MKTVRRQSAFTLFELLAVIAILGILAALAVPALKNIGKSDLRASAARQLLDDVGRARQLAISQHTTVYMVFVPAIWNLAPGFRTPAAANLLDKQYTGYNFLTMRSVGDQPGQGTRRYLGEWKSLPDGAFIALNKFINPALSFTITDFSLTPNASYQVYGFKTSKTIPFPTETNLFNISVPYLAFNYLGQLVDVNGNLAAQDEYLPLAEGIVAYATDINKVLQWSSPDATEKPLGNSTNSMFNLVRIDRLTGRAVQLQQKVQ